MNNSNIIGTTISMMLVVLITIGLLFWGLPTWNVWRREQSGKAQLREAEFSKQIQLEEAKANLEAEKLNAQAEIERAKGASEAIKIEGGNLTNEYIQYLWVRNLENGDNELIYIPTESNLPILEAPRLGE